ncbi:sulfurtransferase TusA family protein [Sphingomonas sp. R86520]|uniref:sulfurtransferase TusA family protein n=1 Tax=Sphingomonas sp. R86520 TaxID=3093859 RepID=UPI0036D2AD1C
MSGVVRIDARGMKCPWPVMRLSRALRAGARIVEVIADDPQAPAELGSAADAFNATIHVVSDALIPTFIVTCR